MITSVKRLAATVAVVALALACAPSARADGDPAGDVLAQQSVFYGSALDLRSKQAAQLPALLAQAKAQGLRAPGRRAVRPAGPRARSTTCGTTRSTTRLPRPGARLRLHRAGRSWSCPAATPSSALGHSSVRDQRVLDKARPGGSGPGRACSRARSTRSSALAGARGIKLTVPDVEPPPGGVKQPGSHFAAATAAASPDRRAGTTRPATSGGGGGAWLFALPVVALVAAAGVLIGRGRLRERSARQA